MRKLLGRVPGLLLWNLGGTAGLLALEPLALLLGGMQTGCRQS